MLEAFEDGGLQGFLAGYGVGLDNGLILDVNQVSQSLGLSAVMPLVSQYGPSKITQDFKNLVTIYPMVRPLILRKDHPDVTLVPLATTMPSSYEKLGKEWIKDEKAAFDAKTDKKGPFTVGAQAEIKLTPPKAEPARKGGPEHGRAAAGRPGGSQDLPGGFRGFGLCGQQLFQPLRQRRPVFEHHELSGPGHGADYGAGGRQGPALDPQKRADLGLIPGLSGRGPPGDAGGRHLGLPAAEGPAMTLRRLIPYVVVFLILAGAYGGLRWRKERQVARDEEAKKVFALKEGDLSDLTLVRGKDEVRLVKKDQIWRLTAPLDTQADQTVVASLLTTLARLRMERDLGAEKDLKPFGLDKPGLVVKFTAQGQPHQLAIGAKVPGRPELLRPQGPGPPPPHHQHGQQGFPGPPTPGPQGQDPAALCHGRSQGPQGQDPQDHGGPLEKTGPQTWGWAGRPDFRVRGDRVEKLLRDLHIARAKNFVEPTPKKLTALDLDPKQRTEITVATSAGDRTLWLGAKKDDAVYARLGAGGAVVLVDAALAGEVGKTMASLEDRRLWSGAIAAVHQVVWGPPGKTWTARKDQESWKITGPDQAATQQPAARLEVALWNFQKLEGEKTQAPERRPERSSGLWAGTPGPGRKTPSAPGGDRSQGERSSHSPHR